MRIKIAIIDNRSLYSRNLCDGFGKLGDETRVLFLAPKECISLGTIESSQCEYKRVWTSHLYPFQIFKMVTSSKPDIAHIQFEFNTFGPNFTIALFPLLLFLLRLSGLKVIITIHGIIPPYSSMISDLAPRGLNAITSTFLTFSLIATYSLINLFCHRIVVHGFVFKRWLTTYYKVNADKVKVIPHGVVDRFFSLGRERSQHWHLVTENKRVILYFGVLSPRKGLEYLLKAYAEIAFKYQDCMLIVSGFEPAYYKGYTRTLEKLVEELEIEERVVFTGFVTYEEVHELLTIAKMVVLPYLHSTSASGPLALAIQYHKPIIATSTEFFQEALKDRKEAILVPPGNSQMLAQAMMTLIEDEDLAAKFTKNLKMKAKKLSWEKVARTTLKLYYDVTRK
jgi:glycosyltransferase involved in cell wall biosynthesis